MDLKLSHGKARPNPTIFHKSVFSIAGLAYTGRNTVMINWLWEKFWQLFKAEIIKINNNQYLGTCFHDIDMRNNEVFEYYAGFEADHQMNIPKGFKTIDIPENDYAVFTLTLHKIRVQNGIHWVSKGRLPIFKDESVLNIR